MQRVSITVDQESERQQVMDLLWHQFGIRGEVQVRPLDGRFRLDIIAERDLTADELARLPGKHA